MVYQVLGGSPIFSIIHLNAPHADKHKVETVRVGELISHSRNNDYFLNAS